ncbi:MAG: GNAT family N-acetyltransferase [Aliishimia sp.]
MAQPLEGTILKIRPAIATDHTPIWDILRPVFRAGDTYSIDADIPQETALNYWCGPTHTTFVAEEDGTILGTYYIRRNQGGGGAHVCNCGYMTAASAQGKGVARAMMEHSFEAAQAAGFTAMQYNFVVETNSRAIVTWQKAGFDIVGRLPGAFVHPTRGPVDALVMYRNLGAVA